MKKSFTLLEFLVVIGIIGILVGFLLPSLATSQMKARDAKRKSDLVQIQKALELYRQDQNPPSFPANGDFLTATSWSSGTTTYMSKVPYDPDSTSETGSGRKSYSYSVNNTNLTFTLCACLENTNDPSSTSTNCNTLSYNQRNCGATGKSYIINEP